MKSRPTRNLPSFAPAGTALCRTLLVIGCGLLLAMALPRAHAAGPPEAMTYQGFLVDANGNALATNNPANYPVIFRIFAAPTGGASLWSEQQIVTVDKGNFSVILSEGTPVAPEPKPLLSTVLATNGADRYIQISVTISGSTLDMLPRLRLLPSPYAFLSTSANQLVNPSGVAVVTYANSRVEVAGNLFSFGTISGNGSGLSGLTAAQIPAIDASKITSGTLPDARLSANVALLAANNAFIGNQTISGNLGLGTPNTTFPLTIGNQSTGDKISLFGQSGNSFGFGMQANLLQIHGVDAASDIVFGYGSSAAMTELMRIDGNGNVGIGTNNPTARLDVNGGIKVSGANTLEFGAGVAGKAAASGQIGYGTYTANALDIVGAGTAVANRKVKIWSEGGAEFTGGIRVRGGPPGANGINNNGYAFTGNGGDIDGGMYSSADGQLEFYANSTERMRLVGGRVGINTATPQAPLEVRGSNSYALPNTQGGVIDYFDANGYQGTAASDPFTQQFSILADQWVGAFAFAAKSDRRIKRGITTSPKEKDLSAILQLRVADYQMVDSANLGKSRRKGFIAQELETVIPGAVSRSLNFIPDIFAFATNAAYVPVAKTLVLSLSKSHELKVGDKVRLQLDNRSLDLNVSQVPSAHEFVVNECGFAPRKEVFVYGKQVSDFRSVDYDFVFSTGISAIQALARKVQELESRQSRLEELEKKASRTAALDKENAGLRASLEQQDKRLAALEILMQQKLNGVQQARLRDANVPTRD